MSYKFCIYTIRGDLCVPAIGGVIIAFHSKLITILEKTRLHVIAVTSISWQYVREKLTFKLTTTFLSIKRIFKQNLYRFRTTFV